MSLRFKSHHEDTKDTKKHEEGQKQTEINVVQLAPMDRPKLMQ
jgi:hypothetical protein